MNLNELLSDNKTAYMIYAGIAIVVIIAIILIARSGRKSKLTKQCDKLRFRLNKLNSKPYNVKIAQAESLARTNKELKESVETCKVDFNAISVNAKKILEMADDMDEDLAVGNLSAASQDGADLEKMMSETERISSRLDDTLKTILEQSTVYLDKNTDLQMRFHAIKNQINANSSLYVDCWEGLDYLSTNISNQFTNMRTAMDFQKYDEAGKIASELETSINEFDTIVSSIPSLVKVAKSDLPNRIREVSNAYGSTVQKGAYLEHLDVNSNLKMISSALSQDIASIQKCEIKDVNENLLDYETRLNQLSNQIEKEDTSFKEVSAVFGNCESNLRTMIRMVTNISNNFEALNDKYGCEPSKDDYFAAAEQCTVLNGEYATLLDTFKSKSVPSSTILPAANDLNKQIVANLTKVNSYVEFYRNAQMDERKAREEVEKYSVVLNEIQANIRLNRIPSISSKYKADIITAEGYVNRLNEILSVTPLDTVSLNATLDKSEDFVCSLHENVNRIISLAGDTENFIIMANKYRPYYVDIDTELSSAQLAYNNGEYSKAWTLAKGALEKVDPAMARSLLAKKVRKEA